MDLYRAETDTQRYIKQFFNATTFSFFLKITSFFSSKTSLRARDPLIVVNGANNCAVSAFKRSDDVF